MRTLLRRLSIGLTTAVCVCLAAPAGAQDSRAIDFGVGYQWLHTTDQAYPFGVNVDVSGRLFAGLRWLGEVGFARDRESDPEFGVDASLSAGTYAAGLRWVVASGRVRPYAQAVVGSQRDAYTLRADGAGELFSESETTLMFQPGGGVTIRVDDQWGLFGQADFRRVFYEDESEDFVRVVTGVRFTLK